MSLAMVVAGVLGQLFLGFFLFMLAVFAGGGAANGTSLAGWQLGFLNAALYILPGLSVISACALIYAYAHHASSSANVWHLLPIAGAAIYIVVVMLIGSK